MSKINLPSLKSFPSAIPLTEQRVIVPRCSPADDHSQDDGEPPILQDLHDGWVLLGDEDPQRGESHEADTDQWRQIPCV